MEVFEREEVRDKFAEIFSYDQELVDKGYSEGVEIVLSLLESGMSIEDVRRQFNLSLDVIKKLA